MAYDERLAERIRAALGKTEHDVVEKKMFGGLCFMVDGHMACGLTKEAFMVRVGKAAYEDALAEPHVRPMTFTGKPLAAFVYVDAPGIATAARLAKWIARGIAAPAPAKRRAPRRQSSKRSR